MKVTGCEQQDTGVIGSLLKLNKSMIELLSFLPQTCSSPNFLYLGDYYTNIGIDYTIDLDELELHLPEFPYCMVPD